MLAEESYLVVFISRKGQKNVDQAAENQRIDSVMASYPQIASWVIGGHSWGANTAVSYILSFPQKVSAIVLWAARLDLENSLAGSQLPVLMVYGTADDENVGLVADMESKLPPQTVWVSITGGNRVGFASFGPMAADVGAAISEQEQQSKAAAATIEFLEQFQP
jgi:pimeloyl-ACP methyl ester carboxylesterase